jgi:hypothetical protein
MLISMPTGTSTILGVFQVIPSSQEVWRDLRADVEPRTASDIAQVRKTKQRTPASQVWCRFFSPGQNDFSLGQDPTAIGLRREKKLRSELPRSA